MTWLVVIGLVGAAGQPAPTAIAAEVAAASPSPRAVATPDLAASVRPTSTPTLAPTPTPTPAPTFAPTGPTTEADVVRVIDGDTIVVSFGGAEHTVRYIGMDTPETKDPSSPIEWMGPEAAAANSALVTGKTVLLERDVSDTDQFDRLLRYVWVSDGATWTLVNVELVRRGFASLATYPPDVRYVELIREAESLARGSGAGLWGATPPPPTAAPTAKPTPKAVKATPKPTAKPKPKPNCHPSYSGVCLKQGAGDYDCAGGSGNGPNYVRGPFRVIGPDDFDLDRDNDGIGCE